MVTDFCGYFAIGVPLHRSDRKIMLDRFFVIDRSV